jgi:neutral amino acid transport system permease protein
MRVFQLALFGLVTGSFLLLATIGFSLTRRVEGFLNIAHAQYMAVAAFLTWFLNAELGWHFLLAATAATATTALLGLGIARLFYDPMKERGPLVLLITSVGVVFLLQGLIDAVFGGGTRVLSIPRPESFALGTVRITNYQVAVILVAMASALGLAAFFTKTKTGLSIRAMAINRQLAGSRGIDIVAASRATWLIASGLAGVAGIILGVLGTLTPELAFEQFLTILAVAILAGLGSFYSVIAAALLIGLAMDLSLLVMPGGWRSMVAFAIVIAVLVIKPTGLGRAASP